MSESGGEYFKRIVAEMTPAQRANRMKKIKRRLAKADRLEKEVGELGHEFQRLDDELNRVRPLFHKKWQEYIKALENCPHPVCL